MGNDVPFVPWTNNIVSWTEISSASRGATRPTWELLYSHYAQIKGSEAPWTTKYLNHTLESFGGIFEGGAGSYGEGSGHYDGLGWGTLLYRRDQADADAAQPSSTSTAVVPIPTLSSTTFAPVAATSSASSIVSASSSTSSVTVQSTSVAQKSADATSQGNVVVSTTLATLTRSATSVSSAEASPSSFATGAETTASPIEDDDDDSCESD